MYYPQTYEKYNKVTPISNKKVLDEYKHLFKWRSDKKDAVLDIGCGPGNLTYKLLLPILPLTFEKLVGADISEVMIEYAKKTYIHEKLSFRVMDISDSNMDKYFPNGERFDHITSFFSLQWIPDQMMVMKNIYNLLKSGGDCLLSILADNDVYEGYSNLYKTGKWSNYMEDYKTVISPYYKNNNKKEDLCKYLESVGFIDYKLDFIENSDYKLHGFEECQNMLRSLNPFVKRVPIDKQEEYINDQIRIQFPYVKDDESKDWIYSVNYSLIVVYARK